MAAGEEEVRAIWKMADAVCFDVDSTVIQEEAIDELARFCGKGDEVAQMRLVDVLHQRSVPVYLISGGLRGVITPVALELNIPLQNIYANRLKFFFNGEFAGFDENEPTSRNGGKGEVIKMLKEKHGYSNVVLIGDGTTDLEACPPADAFIGYGGNVIREEVKSKAKWFVTDFKELIDAL